MSVPALKQSVSFTIVCGIKTAKVTRSELVYLITERIENVRCQFDSSESHLPLTIFDINGHAISLANQKPHFKELLDQADIVHADGQSIVYYSRICKGGEIPERSATTDLIHDIPQKYEKSLTHYLLGGEHNVVSECASLLSSSYPNFKVSDFQHGYFTKDSEKVIIEKINRLKPDILWVGLGKPKEQEFVLRWREQLNVPVIITCGGCYNYVTGSYKRAPIVMQKIGLEWLYRVLTNPRKFFWRYLTTNPHTLLIMIKEVLSRLRLP
ncbi:MAG: glycosyltransferase [Pseudomonadales bacterium]|nr:glycosyltransferase [Pseudomonadales bacterium]